MPIIQITNTYKGTVLDIVRSCLPEGFTLRTLPENTEEALCACVGDAEYILASGRVKINRSVLAVAQKLKMIQRTGVGLDALDLDAIAAKGVPLYVNQGVNTQSVAEHAMLLILACLRKLTLLDANAKKGVWEKQRQGITTSELAGKTIGVVGMGHVGQRVAELLKAFGAKVIYYDKYRQTPEREAALSVEFVEPDALFRRADVITLHCALTEETRGMIRKDTIALMKEGTVIVNTARGDLIEEDDLLAAIQSGRIAFAGLDVHQREPFTPEDKLILSERVIATPHVAGVTYDAFSAMMRDAMRNIALFEKGELEEIREYRMI